MKHVLPLFAGVLLFLSVAGPAPVPAGEELPGRAKGPVLTAAYPNPFYTRTSFSVRVSTTQRVSVGVYNVLGQRVRLLYEGTVAADQPQHFTLHAGTLPSGLYLYRVQGETFVATRRVVLVR